MRLQEAQKLRNEAAQACKERIDEAKALLENERRHTEEVKELLQRRRETSAAAWQHTDELQAQSDARLACCEREVRTREQESRQRIADVTEKTQQQLAHAVQRSQDDLGIARERLAACEQACKYRIEAEAQRKERCDEALQKRRTEAASRLEIDQFIMQRHVANMKEECAAHVQQVVKRQEATKQDVDQKIKTISDVFSSTASRSLKFYEREHHSINSMGHGVYTLGKHVREQKQYTVHVDQQLSVCLHGHLHGIAGVATPSPRALASPRI
jgi:hypothetical protein